MTSSKRAILHVPHSEMLISQPISYWIERFENAARTSPTEVALPGVDYFGPTFKSKVYGHASGHSKLGVGNLLPDWVKQVRDRLGNEAFIWANILPAYSFLETETVMIHDQYGYSLSSQACIVNPKVQRITDEFIDEAAGYGINGIVFDLTDIFPNSTSSILKGLQNTCFCNYCLKQLEIGGWNEKQRPFVGSENISRTCLRPTETGADHLEPLHQWIETGDAEALVEFSTARGFLAEDSENALDDAKKFLRYLGVRGKVTAGGARRLGQQARKQNLTVAIILGDENFDMSQAADVAFMINAESADEYWLPAIEGDFVQAKGVRVVQYLYTRSSYFPNNFFEVVGDPDVQLSTGIENFVNRLLAVSRTMQNNNKLNPGAVYTVKLADEFSGFVGVPTGQVDIVRFVNGLSGSNLGMVVPKHVIDSIIAQVKLSAPEKPFSN